MRFLATLEINWGLFSSSNGDVCVKSSEVSFCKCAKGKKLSISRTSLREHEVLGARTRSQTFGEEDTNDEEWDVEEKKDDVEVEGTAFKYPVKLDEEISFQRPSPKFRYCICQNRNDGDSYIACIRGEKCVLNGWAHSECVGISREAVSRLRNLWVCPMCVLEETK